MRFESLVELYRASCSRYSDNPLFGSREEGGWTWTTYGEFTRLVDAARGGLRSIGVGHGDRVAIVSNNRVEWAVACYATYGLEAVFVPMYEAQGPEEWRYILGDSEAKVAIGSTASIHAELTRVQGDVASLEQVIGLDLPAENERSFAALARKGAEAPTPPWHPSSDTTAGFIYTSGTTGKPKGVILSHGNIVSNLAAMREVFPVGPEERSLSFLPWAHSFGQTCELHYILSSGASMAINDDVRHLPANLADVKPTILVAVPRIFNRLYENVQQEIQQKPRIIQKLFRDGVSTAILKQRGDRVAVLRDLELLLDDKLVFSRVRRRLGGRLKFVITGSAALSRDVAELIDAMGISVYEGYGLSEASPVVAANTPGNRKIGSVGRPLPGVRVEIDTTVTGDPKEGEVVVYGPNVMKGYHNRPEESAAAFTEDGGLRTGDLGYLDDERYLHISGRLKEQYKLANGEFVMPGPLEEQLQLSPFIVHAMLYGENKAYNVALIVPDRAAIERWAQREGIPVGDVSSDPAVRRLVESEVTAYAKSFKDYEMPKKVAIIEGDLTPEEGMLTPTLKLKRRNVMQRYRNVLELLYQEGEPRSRADVPSAPLR